MTEMRNLFDIFQKIDIPLEILLLIDIENDLLVPQTENLRLEILQIGEIHKLRALNPILKLDSLIKFLLSCHEKAKCGF